MAAAQVNRIMGQPVFLAAPVLVDWLFLLLVKLPLIAADLGLGLALRRIVAVRLADPRNADRAFAWYFLNPYIIWISAVWGMFDVLPTLFTLFGIVLFLDRKDARSGLAFGVAVSLKYFPVLFALGLLIAYRGSLTRTRLTRFLGGFVLVLGGVSIPFLLSNPAAYLQGVLSPSSGAYAGRVSAWEVLQAFGIGGLPVWAAAGDILVTFLLVALFAAVRGRSIPPWETRTLWIDASLVAVLVFYVVNFAVNPQYFVWVIPFFILDSVARREPPRLLGITSGLVLAYIVTGVQHYSFFLPMITINGGLGAFVLPMPNIQVLSYGLGFAVWIVMADQLRTRLRNAGGRPAIRRALREAWSALHGKPKAADTGSRSP